MDEPAPIREQPFERPLPSAPEIEKALLGSIFLDNLLITILIELLKPEYFYVPSHRRIFEAMIVLFEAGKLIDPLTVGEELKKGDSLESIGGTSFLVNLTYGIYHFSSEKVQEYCSIVKKKALLRQLIRTANKITNEALEEEDDATIILRHAEESIFHIGQNSYKSALQKANVITPRVIERAELVAEQGNAISGFETGFIDLDHLTGGFQKTDLILLAARPSMGKTSMAGCLAAYSTIHNGKTVAFFSLEQPKDVILGRMICAEADVSFHKFWNGHLNHEEWESVNYARMMLDGSNLFIDDTPGITVTELKGKSMRLISEHSIDLIVVDYLQLMTGGQKRIESRQQEVSQISRDVKGVAKELNVPILALSQLSRAPEGRVDKRPQLADLRESGALEQDADLVAFIYREVVYNTQLTGDNRYLAEVNLAKHRNGKTGTIPLRFNDHSMRFQNLQTHF